MLVGLFGVSGLANRGLTNRGMALAKPAAIPIIHGNGEVPAPWPATAEGLLVEEQQGMMRLCIGSPWRVRLCIGTPEALYTRNDTCCGRRPKTKECFLRGVLGTTDRGASISGLPIRHVYDDSYGRLPLGQTGTTGRGRLGRAQ